MTSPSRRKHRTTAKRRATVNPSAARHTCRTAIITLACGMLALGGIAQLATAADNASHLKWRKPVKDDPFQGIASAQRAAKPNEKLKWQPYRPYKSNPVRRVSTHAASAKKIEKKADAQPAKIAVHEEARKLAGPKLQLAQFDDPFAPPKKEDIGPPKDDPKSDDKKDGEPTPADPFAPPPLDDDKKPGELPPPTDDDRKGDDKDMTPPSFGDPPKDDDQKDGDKKDDEPVDPFGPPKDDPKEDPKDDPKTDPFKDDPVQPPLDPDPKDTEPKDTDTKDTEPKDTDPKDMEPADMPPLLEPGDDGAKPIMPTKGYADVLKMVEERLGEGSLQRISLDITIKGQPDKDKPMSHRFEDDEFVPRSWALTTFTWKASALCHNPLYFEQVHVERYGHAHHPLLEPIVEGAHFFASVPLLPYKMGLQTPHECVYALGYYRPGSCAPYLLDPVPLSLRGALFQGAAVWGGVALLP